MPKLKQGKSYYKSCSGRYRRNELQLKEIRETFFAELARFRSMINSQNNASPSNAESTLLAIAGPQQNEDNSMRSSVEVQKMTNIPKRIESCAPIPEDKRPAMQTAQSSSAHITCSSGITSKQFTELMYKVDRIANAVTRLGKVQQEISSQLRYIQTQFWIPPHKEFNDNGTAGTDNNLDNIPITVFPEQAKTEEELLEMIERLPNASLIARKIESDSARSTIRRFIRMLFSKQLALAFSWSGLGKKRLKLKKSFKDHPVFLVLADVLAHTKFNELKHEDIGGHVQKILSGVGDWDNGRAERTKSSLPIIDLTPGDLE